MNSAAVGLVGDIITFFGGLVLSWDALQARRAYQKRKRSLKHLSDPDTSAAAIGVIIEGRVAMKPEDMELIAVDQTFHRALIGFVILCFGLLFSIASRILELVKI